MGRLYLVATPIGNLGDITYRAVEILRSAALIACEDTRHTRKLLTHIGVATRTISCNGHNDARCVPAVLQVLEDSTDACYVSDAGTPGISDPGASLVRAVRTAGFPVVPIPGPSAVTALLSVSGVAGRGWLFEGFLPPKGRKRLTRLEALATRGEPVVLYESPHRIGKLAAELVEAMAEWNVVVGRELTKIHEQVVATTIRDFSVQIEEKSIPPLGEFTILVWPPKSR